MKLVTYEIEGCDHLGILSNNHVFDLVACMKATGIGDPNAAVRMITLLEADRSIFDDIQRILDMSGSLEEMGVMSRPLTEVSLRAPVPRPGKVLAVAGNYQAHLTEGGGSEMVKERSTPRFFIKPATAVIGPGQPILLPRLSSTVDYEAELGVVIGRAGRYIEVAKALDHVAGYVVFNDISARQLTIAEGREARPMDDFFDWLNGKWFDSFAAMGPYLVTWHEVPDPQALQMRLWVTDELRQEANTGQMIFGVGELIAFISQFTTLEPGDVIATGTTAGVGATTGRYLAAGDIVRCAIEGLGELTNPVQDDTAS